MRSKISKNEELRRTVSIGTSGFARGGAMGQRQTKRKEKLKTKKIKKHIKKRRTYKNKK